MGGAISVLAMACELTKPTTSRLPPAMLGAMQADHFASETLGGTLGEGRTGGAGGLPAPAPGHTRGRLFGRNVLEALFRAAPDEDLFLGELLVGVDEATDRRYLFRVVDVSYGTEHREPGWAERVAGTLLADDARGDAGAHPLYEQARRTYRMAECRCLGYLAPPAKRGGARNVFRKPKSLPTQFSRVVSPAPEDFDFLAKRMGDLPVGHLRSGETVVDFPVGIPGRSLASHIGIFATTGMGKSNLLQVLCAGALQANGRYGLLVIDPHGEHRAALARHPWASHGLRTYSDRRLPNTTTLRTSLAELSVDDLRTAYEWSRPQEEALHELERHYGGEGLVWLADFARLEDLPGFRDVELSARVALNTLQVVHRRARRIVDLPCISADPAVSVGRRIVSELLEGKVVLIDVSGLGGTEEVLVASYLTRRVLEEWQGAFLQDPERHKQLPVVAIALEEAQRVLSASKDRESNVFPRVAREGAQVRRRPSRRDAAAEASRRRTAQPVQHVLRARARRREGPQHPAFVVQAGPFGARPRDSRPSCQASACWRTSRRPSPCRRWSTFTTKS